MTRADALAIQLEALQGDLAEACKEIQVLREEVARRVSDALVLQGRNGELGQRVGALKALAADAVIMLNELKDLADTKHPAPDFRWFASERLLKAILTLTGQSNA